jgi:hypothetical protein
VDEPPLARPATPAPRCELERKLGQYLSFVGNIFFLIEIDVARLCMSE